jgi:predicted NBD/HSP70 family sugar kinase
LAPYFAAFVGVPIFVANDADVLARSELLSPDAHRNALVIKASTGLGMGVIADGAVLTGSRGAIGEIGHTKVDRAAGVPCRCGGEGCLEAIAGGWALVNALKDSGVGAGHVRDLVASALAGDAIARGLLRESGRQVGEVVAVAINLLNPDVVVIGGDMGQAFDVYAAGIRESVYARSTAFATRDLQFLPAVHGDAAGLVGCAALALDHVLAPIEVDARLQV